MAAQPFWQDTEDWHTAGEPFRIVEKVPTGLLTEGLTVAQQRIRILETPSHPLDILRQSLCHEPRGHADMYGGFITPPDDAKAHFGVLFWHKDGFSTACGHGTIALGYWAISHGIVQPVLGGTADVVVDVPSGRVIARATFDDAGDVIDIEFINVNSYQISAGDQTTVDVAGKPVALKVDFSYGGAVYVSVNVADLALHVEPSNYQTFIALSRQIKAQFADFLHLDKYDVYGVCFFEDKGDTADAVVQRNVVVFADGQIDRSPCGSGTCARVAVLLAQGRLSGGQRLIHESILGTRFEARVTERTSNRGLFPGCIPRVRGDARLVGKMNFFIDPTDSVYPGFVFR